MTMSFPELLIVKYVLFEEFFFSSSCLIPLRGHNSLFMISQSVSLSAYSVKSKIICKACQNKQQEMS